MLHKVNISSTGFDFVNFPARITAATPLAVNVIATGSGRALQSSGTRIWDTGVVAATSLQFIAANSFFNFPISSANLPAFLFDAIITVNCDGTTVPLGFSNSPDNQSAYTASQPSIEKKLYWCNLRCFGINNGTGNSNSSNHYMFGGLQSATSTATLDIFFAERLATAVTVNWQLNHYSYSTGLHVTTKSGSVVLAPGLLTYSLATSTQLALAVTYNPGSTTAGYYKISASISDSTFRSLLPFYHWGISA